MKVYKIKTELEVRFLKELKDTNNEYYEKFLTEIEKQKSKLLDKYCNSDIDFKYELFDAWHREILTLEIKKNNIARLKLHKRTISFFINDESILNIIKILKKYQEILQKNDFYIESNDYYDGKLFKVLLVDSDNLYYFEEYNINYSDENSPNAYNLVMLLKEIFALLNSIGINHKNFVFQ